MVGSAGTRQAAARRAPLCHRSAAARAPRTTHAGVHLRPRLAASAPPTASRPCAVRGRRAVVKGVGVRLPNDGQAAADDARLRPPEDATPAAVHAVRVDPLRLVHAPHPHLPLIC
jgi:hypothetical protein